MAGMYDETEDQRGKSAGRYFTRKFGATSGEANRMSSKRNTKLKKLDLSSEPTVTETKSTPAQKKENERQMKNFNIKMQFDEKEYGTPEGMRRKVLSGDTAEKNRMMKKGALKAELAKRKNQADASKKRRAGESEADFKKRLKTMTYGNPNE